MIKRIAKTGYQMLRRPARRMRDVALTSETMFRQYLRAKYGTKFPPVSSPQPQVSSGVLKSNSDWQAALLQLRGLGLPRHHDGPKNWDTLAALGQILAGTSPDAKVLDAGAELYSALLPSLYA